MKKIILFLLISFSIVQAQDSEPTPWDFVWGFSTTPRAFVLDSFKQEKMFTGFQWGSSWQMNNGLMNTGAELNNYVEASGTVNTPISLILQPTFLDSTGYVPGYFGSVMMQYEPTLPLSGSNEGTILRPADSTDPVFGFRYRRGTISSTPSDPNYSRLVLTQADKASYSTVLKAISLVPNTISASSNVYSTLSNVLSTEGNAIMNDGISVFKDGMTLRKSGIDSQGCGRTMFAVYTIYKCLLYSTRKNNYI